jgi:hypothetical protein
MCAGRVHFAMLGTRWREICAGEAKARPCQRLGKRVQLNLFDAWARAIKRHGRRRLYDRHAGTLRNVASELVEAAPT